MLWDVVLGWCVIGWYEVEWDYCDVCWVVVLLMVFGLILLFGGDVGLVGWGCDVCLVGWVGMLAA